MTVQLYHIYRNFLILHWLPALDNLLLSALRYKITVTTMAIDISPKIYVPLDIVHRAFPLANRRGVAVQEVPLPVYSIQSAEPTGLSQIEHDGKTRPVRS